MINKRIKTRALENVSGNDNMALLCIAPATLIPICLCKQHEIFVPLSAKISILVCAGVNAVEGIVRLHKSQTKLAFISISK